MSETLKLAVPTMGKAGLDSERSGHFGHCDCFTIVDIEVGLLSDAGVQGIVAAGMGMRPMMGFQEAGIAVYFDNQTPNVGDVAKMVAAGQVPTMGPENACHH